RFDTRFAGEVSFFAGAERVQTPIGPGPEAPGQLHSPHLAFERARPAASHSYPSAGVHRCFRQITAEVDSLKEEVTTLKGRADKGIDKGPGRATAGLCRAYERSSTSHIDDRPLNLATST
ncbi:hypothetical protein DVH24_017915, partial [Malus domestica]